RDGERDGNRERERPHFLLRGGDGRRVVFRRGEIPLSRLPSQENQCAMPPPTAPERGRIKSSSGSATRNAKPKSRKMCSKASMVACFVTARSSRASALSSATPGGAPFAIIARVSVATRCRDTSPSDDTPAASGARAMLGKQGSS